MLNLVSSTRTFIFILLSVGLHCLSLTCDIRLPIGQQSSTKVTIGYVARAIEDFQPLPAKFQNQALSNSSKPLEKEQNANFHIQSGLSGIVSQEKKIVKAKRPQLRSQIKEDHVEIQPVPRTSAPQVNNQPLERGAVETSLDTKTVINEVEPPLSPASAEGRPALNQEQRTHENLELKVEAKDKPQNTIDTNTKSFTATSDETLWQTAAYDQKNAERAKQPQVQSALPRYDINPRPEYPRIAKLRGWEGEVLFEVFVLKNGRVGDLKLLTSSGYKSLDDAAKKALARWRFKPAIASGFPVESHVRVPIRFSLRTL